jgi:O-antigen/teichoic acid export membrane protein
VSSTGRTIAKNATMLMASQVVSWGLMLILTIFLPRYLGAANIGKLHLANSMWAIVGVFATFGMDILLTKEIARAPERATGLFANTVIVRVGLHALGYVVIILYLWLLRDLYPAETAYVVYIVGASALVWQISSAGRSVLQGLERMEYISLANIAGKAVNTLAAIAVLLSGLGVYVVAAVAVGAALVTLNIELVAIHKLTGSIKLHFDGPEAWRMLRASLPYFLSGVFLVIYMQADIVIISLLVDERAIGWYGAADQLFGTFLFIPTVFVAAVFPALSRMYVTAADSLPRLIRKSWDLLILLSIPIGLGLVVVADPLVVLLFGAEFAASGPILALMGIVLMLTYQNILLGQFLISTDRQNPWIIVLAIAVIAKVPLDFLFVPWCQREFGNGAMGGAISFIVTELTMCLVGLRLLPRGSLGRSNVRVAALGLASGLAMVAAAWPLRGYFLGLPIAVGALVYVALVILLRVLPPEDFRLARSLAQGAARRLVRRPASL